VRNEDPALNVVPIGWAGQILHPGTQSWYHIAIPTTVIVTDIRQRIDSAMVKFDTIDASLRSFHVYDGPDIIAIYDGLNSMGQLPFDRFPVPPDQATNQKHWVGLGIGISMNFALGPSAQARVRVNAAGVDFV
jgi:hypothetical protein